MAASTVALAESIRRNVEDRNLPSGTCLGTEADLAEQYGVSRGVAREAVMHLKSLGVLESRQRKGLIVRSPDPLKLLSDSLPFFADSADDLGELAGLRYVIEVGAIELAVLKASDDQIARLNELADAFEAVVKAHGSDEQEDELELAFHGLILEMSGSRLVAGLQRVLSRFFKLREQGATVERQSERTVWEHHALVAAIRDRDVERARTFIRNHFRNLIDGGASRTDRRIPAVEENKSTIPRKKP